MVEVSQQRYASEKSEPYRLNIKGASNQNSKWFNSNKTMKENQIFPVQFIAS